MTKNTNPRSDVPAGSDKDPCTVWPRNEWVLALGSNLGSRASFLHFAEALIESDPDIKQIARSSRYLSPPMGPPQPHYLNAALRIQSSLPPLELLDRLQKVENLLRRERGVRFGPRTLDIDILEGPFFDHPRLQIPHPRLHQRAFALRPLLEVAPEFQSRYAHVLAVLEKEATQRLEHYRESWPHALDPADALALAFRKEREALWRKSQRLHGGSLSHEAPAHEASRNEISKQPCEVVALSLRVGDGEVANASELLGCFVQNAWPLAPLEVAICVMNKIQITALLWSSLVPKDAVAKKNHSSSVKRNAVVFRQIQNESASHKLASYQGFLEILA